MSLTFAGYILHEAQRIPSPRHVLRNRFVEQLRTAAKSGRSLKDVRRPRDLVHYAHGAGFDQMLIDTSGLLWAEFERWARHGEVRP